MPIRRAMERIKLQKQKAEHTCKIIINESNGRIAFSFIICHDTMNESMQNNNRIWVPYDYYII